MDALNQVWEFVRPYIGYLGLGLTWAGIGYVAFRNRRDFSRKCFDQINFSLNYLIDGRLAMRTLLEATPKEVWLNDYGVKLVVSAAQKTRADQPFVLLENGLDMGYVKRALKNVLSEHFALAYLAESQGVAVHTATYVYALTYERYDTIRELKFRVVIAERESLLRDFGPGSPPLHTDNARHKDRIAVLQRMAHLLATGEKVEGVDVFDRVVLGVTRTGC